MFIYSYHYNFNYIYSHKNNHNKHEMVAFMCIRVNIMADISENLIFPLSKLRAL